MAINYQFQSEGGSRVDERWRRTRGDNGENIEGEIQLALWPGVAEAFGGVIPSGVALAKNSDGYYVLWAEGDTLVGFISDIPGVSVKPGMSGAVQISVSIRETIVPAYLPVAEQRVIDSKTPTTGDFVFIK